MLMDGQPDGQTDGLRDDRQKVITIAHPEHSPGELTIPLFCEETIHTRI